MVVCRLCRSNDELQNSHIIPEFVYKPLYDDKHRLRQLIRFDKQPKYLQKGLREKLLCFSCEQLLNNRYEKYFKQFWFDENALPIQLLEGNEIKISNIEYSRFKLFHLSVLFRACVSSLKEFECVNLGVHEETIREMLLNNRPESDKKYPILCHGLTKNGGEIQYGLITQPFKTKQPTGNISYGFCFGGCVWYYIVDSREIEVFSSFMLTSRGELNISSSNWEILFA